MSKAAVSYHFKHLLEGSQSFSCNSCLFFRYKVALHEGSLYFMINKNYGTSPERNLLKRRVRCLYKKLCPKEDNQKVALMVKPLKQQIKYGELLACFDLLNKKLA